MADQEFLASFGVDIDESGVRRLQHRAPTALWMQGSRIRTSRSFGI